MNAKTIASRFSKQLASLMKTLDETRPQFVRCIKPNAQKKPGIFEPTLCLEQLRYSGVFEATSIKKSGFPFRFTHEQFVKRYKCVGVPEQPLPPPTTTPLEWAQAARSLMISMPRSLGDGHRLRLGATMVLWRVREHETLELLRNLAVEARVIRLQSGTRRALAVRLAKRARHARQLCDAAAAARDEAALEAAVAVAAALPIQLAWARKAQELLVRLRTEKRVREAMTRLVAGDADAVFAELSTVLEEADALGPTFTDTLDEAVLERARRMVYIVAGRREARVLIRQIIDKEALEKGLALAKELEIWDGHSVETAVADEDREALKVARVALRRIQQEEALLGELRHALFETGVLQWDDAHQPLLTLCRRSPLDMQLSRCEDFGARTADGLFLQEAARAVLALRSAVLAAGDGDWSDDQALAVEEALTNSRDLHERVPELAAAWREAALRAETRDVADQLDQATQVLHHEALKMGLEKAAALEMAAIPTYTELVANAAQLDVALDGCRAAMRDAIEAVSLEMLTPALEQAAALGLGHYEQPAASHLASEIARLLAAADAALNVLVPADLRTVLEEADALNLKAQSFEQIRDFLQLPTPKFLSEQLKAAVRLGDFDRQDDLQMEIKDDFYERSGPMFTLDKFPQLRSPDDFANSKMGFSKAKAERREGFLRHQTKALPTSLSQLESKRDREEAVQMFKSVMGYMGDVSLQFPLMLVAEIVEKATTCGAPLQTELYMQLMKQLSDNPNPESEQKGWQLMALALGCFPPDAMVEHFVEYFLRTHAKPHPTAYIYLMYRTVRRGPLKRPLSKEKMQAMLLLDCSKERPGKLNPLLMADHETSTKDSGSAARDVPKAAAPSALAPRGARLHASACHWLPLPASHAACCPWPVTCGRRPVADDLLSAACLWPAFARALPVAPSRLTGCFVVGFGLSGLKPEGVSGRDHAAARQANSTGRRLVAPSWGGEWAFGASGIVGVCVDFVSGGVGQREERGTRGAFIALRTLLTPGMIYSFFSLLHSPVPTLRYPEDTLDPILFTPRHDEVVVTRSQFCRNTSSHTNTRCTLTYTLYFTLHTLTHAKLSGQPVRILPRDDLCGEFARRGAV